MKTEITKATKEQKHVAECFKKSYEALAGNPNMSRQVILSVHDLTLF